MEYRKDIDSFTDSMYDDADTFDDEKIQAFIDRCTSAGMPEHEIVIVIERLILKKTYRQITLEHGYTDDSHVKRIYKIAYKKAANICRKDFS